MQVQHNANYLETMQSLRDDAVGAVCGQHARTEGFTWRILLSQSVKKYPTASFAKHNTLFMYHCLLLVFYCFKRCPSFFVKPTYGFDVLCFLFKLITS